mgnify:CR=1 FL=1
MMSRLPRELEATDMVDSGVFSSWVMLFTKSFFISESRFCLKIMNSARLKSISSRRVMSREDPPIIPIDFLKCSFSLGK